MPDVVYRMSADEGKAVQGILKVLDSQKKVEKQFKNIERSGKKATDTANQGLQQGVRELGRFAGALGLVTSVTGGVLLLVNRLRAEYQHLVEQQRSAAAAQVTVGEARGAALLNKPDRMSGRWLDKLVADTAQAQGIPQALMWQTASSMLSSKGDLSDPQFAAAMRETARVRAAAGPAVDTAILGGGLQDIMRVTGLKDPRAAGGWVRSIGQQSRVVELGKMFRGITPVVSAAKPFGFSAERAAEMWAYITQATGDPMGETAMSGAINFMQTINKGTTEGGALIPTAGRGGTMGFRTLAAGGEAGLAELQNAYAAMNAAQRNAFAAKIPGEAKVKGALLNLIARDPGAMGIMGEVARGIPAPGAPGVAAQWESYFTDVARGPHEGVRDVRRGVEAFVEDQMLRNPQAVAGELREQLRRGLGAIPGVSQTAIDFASAEFEIRSNFGRDDALGAVRSRFQGLRDKYGYGAPYRRRRADYGLGVPAGSYRESMPEGATFHEAAGRQGAYWMIDPPGPMNAEYYERNPNYQPGQEQALDRLLKTLDSVINGRQPLKVEVSNRPVNPNAQTEEGP